MKHIKLITATVLFAALTLSCRDNAELESRIDDLEARLKAIELVIGQLNDNVAALQAIAEGKTISEVTEENGVYTLRLSNGQVLTLTQGSVGIGKAPLMSIDSEGYWMVDYQDGNGLQYVLMDGQKVIAKGNHGITPQFSVDAEGYWIISYDGSVTFTQVLDVNGNPVKAVAEEGGEESYFADVTYTDEALILTLKNGQQYKAPVEAGFLFMINAPESDQTFRWGEKKTFGVVAQGNIASTAVIAPENWKAYLSNAILTIQAPQKPEVSTKAYIADSRKDVSIIAVSQAGHISIAKVRVFIDGEAGSVDDPAAGIKLVDAKATSLTFNIVLENATTWYYILRLSTDPIPTITQIVNDGSLGPENNQVIINDLIAETKYTLYVVPVGPTGNGAMAVAEAKTAAYDNYYEAWEAGKDIKVGGRLYNKANYGVGIHVESNMNLSTEGGVYFIEEGITVSIPQAIYNGSFLLIGNRPGKKGNVSIDGVGSNPPISYNNNGEIPSHNTIAFKNVNLKMHDGQNNIYGNTAIGYLIFEEVKLKLTRDFFTWAETPAKTIAGLIIKDCDIRVAPVENRASFISTHVGNNCCSTEIVITNNIVWKEGEPSIFSFVLSPYGTGVDISRLLFENNTLYNVDDGNNNHSWGYVQGNSFSGQAIVRNNLSFTPNPAGIGKPGSRQMCFLSLKGSDFEPSITYFQENTYASNNWVNYPDSRFLYCRRGDSVGKSDFSLVKGFSLNPDNSVKSFENPFSTEDTANGQFIQKNDYKMYGAKR
jgi:hypothetical protein